MGKNTIADRVCEMATDLRAQLMERSIDVTAYSIAVDEGTDIKGTAQLANFLCRVDSNLCVTEETLDFKSMHGTTTGKDIFHTVCQNVTDKNLPLDKFIGLTTDGALVICSGKWTCGKDTGKN